MEQDAAIHPIFARHETFHPRFGWLKKGFDKANDDNSLFSKESAPAVLGVGKNMVKAIKYWCLAFKVVDESRTNGKYVHKTTDFAEKLLSENGWDPYLENPSSLWLLQAIDQSGSIKTSLNKWAKKWQSALTENEMSNHFSVSDITSIYPLHPLSALILPILCTKYSQNDRTLFTFLASGEPDSLSTFLTQTAFSEESPSSYKLNKVYDYFVESAGMSISARPQFQKWIEIQSRLSDASNLDPDNLGDIL